MQSVSDPLEVFTARIMRRSGSQRTVVSYRFQLLWFLKWLDLSPADFISKVESGQISAEDQINAWLDHLQVEGMSPATQILSYYAIKKFLTVNLPRHLFYWDSVELPKARNIAVERIPSRSELLRIMNRANLRDRVLISLAVSSGARRGTLAGLKVKDMDLVSYPDVGVVSVPGELNKAKFAYTTFITPQARTLLEEYLKDRKPLDPESPLLLDQKERGGQTGTNLARRWNELLRKTELDQRSKRLHVLRFHVLRKYCATALTSSGVNLSARERMLGHKGGGGTAALSLDHAYYRPEIVDLLAEYRKAIPALTIAEETVGDYWMKRQMILDTIKAFGFDHGIYEEVEASFEKHSKDMQGYKETVEEIPRILRAAHTFRVLNEENKQRRKAKKK